ncbi:hypothetical protein KY347_01735 [Candidatus Woesearchaeota archaeon]|nr:hypothetical protein [Candidatus Woesearchaeota archaeon]
MIEKRKARKKVFKLIKAEKELIKMELNDVNAVLKFLNAPFGYEGARTAFGKYLNRIEALEKFELKKANVGMLEEAIDNWNVLSAGLIGPGRRRSQCSPLISELKELEEGIFRQSREILKEELRNAPVDRVKETPGVIQTQLKEFEETLEKLNKTLKAF